MQPLHRCCGPGSSVGIATGYGLDGPGIESRWGEIFRTCPNRPWGPTSLLYNGYRVFPGGKKRPGRDAEPSPFLVPWSWKGRAIPLLPLWVVRPVQSLSACTRVTFTFLYLHFSLFPQPNSVTLSTLKKAATTSFPIVSNAVFSTTVIRRCIVWVTDSFIKRTANK